jgi:hypothetical protein
VCWYVIPPLSLWRPIVVDRSANDGPKLPLARLNVPSAESNS